MDSTGRSVFVGFGDGVLRVLTLSSGEDLTLVSVVKVCNVAPVLLFSSVCGVFFSFHSVDVHAYLEFMHVAHFSFLNKLHYFIFSSIHACRHSPMHKPLLVYP